MSALDARNRMSHSYSLKAFERIIADIRTRYLAALNDLETTLLGHAQSGDSA